MSSNFIDVGTFHHRFGLDHVVRRDTDTHEVIANEPGPREIDTELLEFRIKFLAEELQEFAHAAGFSFEFDFKPNFGAVVDHPKAFDALLDLAYVVFGTAHLLGYPWQEGWARVQYANMQKERADGADDQRSTRKHTLDVVKPEGWEPPDIKAVLEAHGFVV